MHALERWSAWFILANGAIGVTVSVGAAATQGSAVRLFDAPPYLSLLGILAGLLCLRGKAAGLAAGLLFYVPQVVSFYSRDIQFNFKSGISYATVIGFADGVLVINLAACACLMVLGPIIVRRVQVDRIDRIANRLDGAG